MNVSTIADISIEDPLLTAFWDVCPLVGHGGPQVKPYPRRKSRDEVGHEVQGFPRLRGLSQLSIQD